MTTTDMTIDERLTAAQGFLDRQAATRPVEAAQGRLLLGRGGSDGVLAALVRYQNDDGGFGNALEPDISAPQSNPFAARLALHTMLDSGIPTDDPAVTRLVGWLERTQGEDGCWRWEPGTLDHPIAPWFAGWAFPALNPALDLAGALARLGLGSERLHRRSRALYARLASGDEIANGSYYVVLPYAGSLPWLTDLPDREASLDALAAHIAQDVAAGAYTTPQEAAEHIGPANGPIARRLPPGTLERIRADVLATQQPDGHWQSPFSDQWNPSQTLGGMAILMHFPG